MTLKDIMNFKNGKKRPVETGSIPVYGGNGILGYTKDFNSQNCVVIGRVGAYCGSVFRESGNCWVSDNAICCTANNNSDITFDYYLLKSLHLNERHIGTSQPLLTQEILNRIEVLCPSLAEQKEIGSALSLLDDKIELNQRINENLERQAEAVFKSWFVDFEQNGGAVPNEWSDGTLGGITTIASGKRPPMKQALPSKYASIPLVGASSIMGYTNAVLYDEPILVTGRVGTHGVVQRFHSPCWPSDNTLVIKSDFYEYAYQVLLRVDYVNMNRGSTQPLITQTDLKNVPIILPTKNEMQEFEKMAGTLMAMYEANQVESEKLVALRDTLLPKLMSGEIDVSNIQC